MHVACLVTSCSCIAGAVAGGSLSYAGNTSYDAGSDICRKLWRGIEVLS